MPKTAAAPVPLDDLLCFSIYSANLAFSRVYKPILEDLGLTYPQYIALVALYGAEDQTVKALGEKLLLDSNTLTPLLKRLEAMGLVTRRRDTRDERQVLIGLTPAGRALRERAAGHWRTLSLATGLPDGEIPRLRDDIATLRDNLKAAARD